MEDVELGSGGRASLTVRFLEPGRKRRRRKLSLTPVLWFLAAAMVLALAAQALIR